MPRFLPFITKHKKRSTIIGIILLALIFFLWPRPEKPIDTQLVKRQTLVQSLSETGTVDSETSVNLSFLISGKLVYLGPKKDDIVKKGEVIATVDQRTLQKNLETALRNYSEQRNTFDQTLDNNQNRIPEESLNDSMKRILENNQYDLDKAVISVDLQDLAKQQSVLTSPINGILTREDVTTTGVNVGVTNVFTVADLQHLVFKIDVDEADIGKIQIGKKVNVTLDPYPDRTLTLNVTNIDFVTHTTSTGGNAYTVETSLPANNNFDYRIGMNGDAEIILDERKNVLTIPLSSITNDHFVYVQTPKGFEKRDIRVGLSNDTDVEIISGLQTDEKVALDPTQAAKVKQKRFFVF